jgi:hypothetical protein
LLQGVGGNNLWRGILFGDGEGLSNAVGRRVERRIHERHSPWRGLSVIPVAGRGSATGSIGIVLSRRPQNLFLLRAATTAHADTAVISYAPGSEFLMVASADSDRPSLGGLAAAAH